MSRTRKKEKRPDKRPARDRYWNTGRLKKRKVKNLMKNRGMTRAEATLFWIEVRKGRVRGVLINTA